MIYLTIIYSHIAGVRQTDDINIMMALGTSTGFLTKPINCTAINNTEMQKYCNNTELKKYCRQCQ